MPAILGETPCHGGLASRVSLPTVGWRSARRAGKVPSAERASAQACGAYDGLKSALESSHPGNKDAEVPTHVPIPASRNVGPSSLAVTGQPMGTSYGVLINRSA